MFSYYRIVSTAIRTLTLFALLFLPSTQFVKAQEVTSEKAEATALDRALIANPNNGISLNWRVEVDFAGDRLHVVWIMSKIEKNTTDFVVSAAPSVTVTDVVTTDITEQCHIFGNVQIHDEAAHFSKGGGYIACELPYFPHMARKYDSEVKRCRCQYESIDMATLFVAAEFNTSPNADPQPIMAYDKMLVTASSDSNSAQTHLLLEQEPFSSNQVSLTDGLGLRSTYLGLNKTFVSTITQDGPYRWLYSENLRHAAHYSTNKDVIGWLEEGDATITPFSFAYTLDVNTQQLFIGLNPTTGETADNLVLSRLVGDPGCSTGLGG